MAADTYYYGETLNPVVPLGDADWVAAVNLYTSTLNVQSGCQPQHVNHEFWYGTTPHATRWIEVGFKDGSTPDGCATQALFWGENYGAGYKYHATSVGWSFNTWYQLWIGHSTTDSCAWIPTINGISLGTSMSNCGGSGRCVAAGIEVEHSQTVSQAKGCQYNWQRADSSDTWHSDWGAGFGLSPWSVGNPPAIIWTDGTHTATEEVHRVNF